MAKFRVRITSITPLRPRVATPERLEAIGVFLVQQVKKRFATRGLSGGVSWPKKARNDGRAILTGRTGALLNSFFSVIVGRNAVAVASSTPYAKVHQLGTIGKGGKLPTIRPRRAKALWIPMNDRAARFGPGAPGLRKGKDFFFARKVDIPPRPMLPDGSDEKKAQVEFVRDLLEE